ALPSSSRGTRLIKRVNWLLEPCTPRLNVTTLPGVLVVAAVWEAAEPWLPELLLLGVLPVGLVVLGVVAAGVGVLGVVAAAAFAPPPEPPPAPLPEPLDPELEGITGPISRFTSSAISLTRFCARVVSSTIFLPASAWSYWMLRATYS